MESTNATLYDLTIKKIIMEKIDYSCLPSLLKIDIESMIKFCKPILRKFNKYDRKFNIIIGEVEDPHIKKFFTDHYTAAKSKTYNQYLMDQSLILGLESTVDQIEYKIYLLECDGVYLEDILDWNKNIF